jgi:hypothetical protein
MRRQLVERLSDVDEPPRPAGARTDPAISAVLDTLVETCVRLRENTQAAKFAAEAVCLRAGQLRAEADRRRADARELVRQSRAMLATHPSGGDRPGLPGRGA